MSFGNKKAHKKGLRSEKLFFKVFTKYKQFVKLDAPEWYKGIRKGTAHEDSRGADFFIITDIGEIPVDVKSGYERAEMHNSFNASIKSRELIAVVWVGDSFHDHAQCIRLRTFKEVSTKREMLLSRSQ